jgi:uncharacterized membrane protein
MILSISLIVVLDQVLRSLHESIHDREFIVCSIMYAYVFAMINVSGTVIVISRYIADKMYVKDVRNILSSLLGVLACIITTSGLVGLLFFQWSPLPIAIKIPSYLLFVELSILFLLMVYVSALKNYKRIASAYAIGVSLILLCSIVLILSGVGVPFAVLVSFDFGFFVSVLMLLSTIQKAFPQLSDKPFDFLVYIRKMPLLFLTNVFYTLSLFVHNFLFWLFSDLSLKLDGTYIFAPAYDSATFFAVLTIIPLTVLFVVKMETSFFVAYRNFCQTIFGGANLNQIHAAKAQMIGILRKELSRIFEIQLVVTILLILFGVNVFLPLLRSDALTIDLFALMAIAYFLTYMTFIVITLLLYFDDQEATLIVSGLFLATTIFFTVVSLLLGVEFYGLGLIVSSTISLLVGLFLLNRTVNQIDYRMFSKQPYLVITDRPVAEVPDDVAPSEVEHVEQE